MTAPAPAFDVPTLAHVLQTFAGQIGVIRTEQPVRKARPYADRVLVSCGLGGYRKDCPVVIVQVAITPASIADDPWGVWAQVALDGKACGNRCGGADAYAQAMAPVIAWVAAYWAKQGGAS